MQQLRFLDCTRYILHRSTLVVKVDEIAAHTIVLLDRPTSGVNERCQPWAISHLSGVREDIAEVYMLVPRLVSADPSFVLSLQRDESGICGRSCGSFNLYLIMRS